MKVEQYPPQEPLSPVGAKYHERVLALGQGIEGEEAAYGPDPYQSLVVFRPAKPSGDTLVFFHGGGWTNGYKEWMAFMAPALTEQGVTLVNAGYRLAPQHVFPTGLEDCADAVAWVVNHIGGRIFVGGHSAGGHYAALLAVTSAWRKSRGLQADALAGCLPVSGVYRFGEGSGLSQRPRFLGTAADEAASPLQQLEPAACPPFYLTWGEKDFPHLQAKADEFAQALRTAGVPVQTEVLPGADHFDASVACGERGGWPARAARWMHQSGARVPTTGEAT